MPGLRRRADRTVWKTAAPAGNAVGRIAAVQRQLENISPVPFRRNGKNRNPASQTRVGDRVRIGAALQQKQRGVMVAPLHCQSQRRVSRAVSCLEVAAMVQQKLEDLCTAAGSGQRHRGLAAGEIGVGSLAQGRSGRRLRLSLRGDAHAQQNTHRGDIAGSGGDEHTVLSRLSPAAIAVTGDYGNQSDDYEGKAIELYGLPIGHKSSSACFSEPSLHFNAFALAAGDSCLHGIVNGPESKKQEETGLKAYLLQEKRRTLD